MPKKRVKKSLFQTNKNTFLILGISIILGFFLILLKSNFSAISPQISLVSNPNLPVCKNFAGITISKTSLKPGEKFTYTCNYGNPVLSCAGGVSEPNNLTTNVWSKFTHNPAVFEATAPMQPGNYTLHCELFDTTACKNKGVNPCQNRAKAISYTVIGTVAASPSVIPSSSVTPSLSPLPSPSKPPIPTNLRITCGTAGKTADLIWDTVTNIDSYKVRLDDRVSHITYSDNIKESKYTVNILPNKVYSFWVHTSKSGIDSNQSTTYNFTCLYLPVPTSPRLSCSSDGKTVKLSWDSVSNASSYKVRLDDKKGKITYIDGLTKTEYVASINPGQTYTWWAHTTIDGKDSAETERKEFKCMPIVVASTTPKPSPSPSVSPKPSPSPSVSPSPSIKPSLKPSPTMTPSPTPTPSPVAVAKPGFFARLYAWFASLFTF